MSKRKTRNKQRKKNNMGKSVSVPSDKFRENYDKVFKKDKDIVVPLYDKYFKELLGQRAKGWKMRYPDLGILPIAYPRPYPFIPYNPYLPMVRERFSNEIDTEANVRIMRIIQQARNGGLDFDATKYHVVFNHVDTDSELSMTQLALRGLFTSPQFIKTFFAKNMQDQPFNIARYHAELFQAETVEGMITYLEDFLEEKKSKFVNTDDLGLDDVRWSYPVDEEMQWTRKELEGFKQAELPGFKEIKRTSNGSK